MSLIVLNLLCYEEVFRQHNSWEREYNSLMVEWDAHNDIARFDFTDRSKHVDFDYAERNVGYWYYYEKAVAGGIEYIWNLIF